MLSPAEENYLKAIYALQYDQGSPISTNLISEKICTKASSVTDMLKKLSAKNLVDYQKYQGVFLTDQGMKHALKVLRKHRLWEFFLVEKLNYKWEEVHVIAEQLEHINSESLVDNLDAFLGYPKFDPHGDPIPDKNGKLSLSELNNLLDVKVGGCGVLKYVKDSSEPFLKYLNKINLSLGDRIEIVDREPFDDSLKIRIHERHIQISKIIAENLFIKNQC
jgi:DtxR family Mn-dependent transcriptional regulator